MTATVSERTKHTGFSCDEVTELGCPDLSICPGIRDARHNFFSASTMPSQIRNDLPKITDFMGEKQIHIHQSPLNPPDRTTTISSLLKNVMNAHTQSCQVEVVEFLESFPCKSRRDSVGGG